MSESPFKKKKVEFKREQSTYESVRDGLMNRLDAFFLSNLPSEDIKAMSPEYLYPIGGFALLALIAIFLAIFLNGYFSSIHNEYLSPSSSTVASKHCVTIPTINTGTYLATQSGKWQGADGFEFGNAAYVLSVTSLSLDVDEYTELMTRAYISLQPVNDIAKTYDLAQNLIYWMSGVFIPFEDNSAQRLAFTGTPLVVFDRQKIVGTMANVMGSCNATSLTSFDSSTGKITLVYNYLDYISSPACMSVLDPAMMGYYAPSDKNEFKVTFDVRTMITTVAINMGVLGVDELVRIPAFDTLYDFEGETYNTASYYDPKYKGMDPVTCIQLQGYNLTYGYTQCTMVIEKMVYALPIFNHMGTSADNPIPCNCSALNPVDLENKAFVCNLFNFISGIVFYPTNDPSDATRLLFKIGLVPTTINGAATYKSEINQVAFPAMFIDSMFGQDSPNRTLFETPAYRQNAYSFCNLTNDEFGNATSCGVVTFTLFDLFPSSWTISEYYYQLTNGACNASFAPDQATWDLLIEEPFAPLTQDYQKCTYDTSAVVLSQAGSSVGNVSILAPFCIAFILLCVYFAQRFGFVQIKKTYTEAEKANALSDLALKLLLARDRELGDAAGKDNSVLARLVEELARDPETLYRTETRPQREASVNWDSLKSSVGLKKRTESTTGKLSSVATPSTSTQSLQLEEEGRKANIDQMGGGEGEGVELRPVRSPLHHFGEMADAVVAMRAGRNQFVVLNDYEVTPALLQLCGVERKESNGSDKDGKDSGKDTTGKDPRDLNVPALFALLDRLVEAFESAASGADKSRSVWAQVSQTAILRVVRVSTLSKPDSRALYYKLNALLSLHASAVLGVPLEEVKRSHSDKVAYMVGLQPLTLYEVRIRC